MTSHYRYATSVFVGLLYMTTFRVIKTPAEYVDVLLTCEQCSAGPISFASSFVSSNYFSEEAIKRFYSTAAGNLADACNTLLQRRHVARLGATKVARREIYEAAAFTKLLTDGTVHTQDATYRNWPSEIESVLTEILRWSEELRTLRIAITTEVLPAVFAIYSPTVTVIDIRTNYLYQQIQGFEIQDAGATQIFQEEFERLWQDAVGVLSPDDVLSLLSDSLAQWRKGATIDLSRWPRMRYTDRAV